MLRGLGDRADLGLSALARAGTLVVVCMSTAVITTMGTAGSSSAWADCHGCRGSAPSRE
ncbi:hypothetical protein AB0D42_36210 [Streptomyces sp. NPDC048304]|uniref:hypothetical protein n=1 Tax=Streptomyces sp. NPDC048304 TaxID=3154820 RepID=UPI0033EB0DEB